MLQTTFWSGFWHSRCKFCWKRSLSMMLDIAVMPQPVQVKATSTKNKSTPSAQQTRSAMQSAANDADTSTQAVTTAPQAVSQKPTGEKEKQTEQPVQFLSVLMAQLAVPVEQDPVAQESSHTPAQNSQQSVTDASQTEQSATTLAAAATVTPLAVSTQPVSNPVVTTTQQAVPVTDAAEAPVAQPQAAPVAAPPATSSPAELPAAEAPQIPAEAVDTKAHSTGKPQNQVEANPLPAAAQTFVAKPVKNTTESTQAITNAQNSQITAPTDTATDAASKIPTPTVPNKPALAEALTSRTAAENDTAQTTPAVKTAPQTSAAAQAPRTTESNSKAWSHNPNLIAAGSTQESPAAVIVPQTTASTTTATSAVDSSASAVRPVTNQIIDNVRSAAMTSTAGSDKTLTISLNPPELGRVVVRMQDDGGGITAVLRVDNPVTRSDIEQSVPSIVRSLEQAGVQVRRVEVLPSDALPQEGSTNRQYDFQQGMPNQQRESHQNASSGYSGQNAGGAGSWQDLQPAGSSALPQSTVSDSAINVYV
jgi:flagellar hook-length control protein FliK